MCVASAECDGMAVDLRGKGGSLLIVECSTKTLGKERDEVCAAVLTTFGSDIDPELTDQWY